MNIFSFMILLSHNYIGCTLWQVMKFQDSRLMYGSSTRFTKYLRNFVDMLLFVQYVKSKDQFSFQFIDQEIFVLLYKLANQNYSKNSEFFCINQHQDCCFDSRKYFDLFSRSEVFAAKNLYSKEILSQNLYECSFELLAVP